MACYRDLKIVIFWGCKDSEAGAQLPDDSPPLPYLYREHLSTVGFPFSLKKEGVVPSKTLGTIYHSTRRYIAEHSRRRENLNSDNFRAISGFINKIDFSAVGREEGWRLGSSSGCHSTRERVGGRKRIARVEIKVFPFRTLLQWFSLDNEASSRILTAMFVLQTTQ
jgi:hypothetical protein